VHGGRLLAERGARCLRHVGNRAFLQRAALRLLDVALGRLKLLGRRHAAPRTSPRIPAIDLGATSPIALARLSGGLYRGAGAAKYPNPRLAMGTGKARFAEAKRA
jgi:hypothetical protein